jgi:PmbA protein
MTVFAHSRAEFQDLVERTLHLAHEAGASDASAEVSEGCGLSVSARLGRLENVERNRDKALGVSVYLGQRRGHASTSDFSDAALRATVQAAYDIARFTAEDPSAGLPDADDLLLGDAPDLDLFHPWAIDAAAATELALRCEGAALATDRRITNSEGAAVSAQQSHFWSGNSRGFRGGYASSRHSISVAPIAGRGAGMQRDAWYSSMRDAADLASPEAVGRYAAERALSRLKARRVPTAEVPVLFENQLGVGPARCTRAGQQRRRALPQGQFPDRQPGPGCAGFAHRHRRGPVHPQGQGQFGLRRGGRAHARAARRRRPGWCRATSCPATRRASSA